MTIDVISLLTESIVMLLALSVLSKIFSNPSKTDHLVINCCIGMFLGAVGVFILFFSNQMVPGVIFDLRSIFLSLIALMYGAVPTLIATCIMIIYRIFQGGTEVIFGVLVLCVSSVIGLFWNRLIAFKSVRRKITDYYLLGLTIHTVIFLTLLLQTPALIIKTIYEVGLPVLAFYPFVTMIMGKLLDDHTMFITGQDAIRRSETKFRMIFEHAPIGIGYATLDGEFMEVNNQYASMLGYSKKEIKHLSFRDITHSEDLVSQIEKIEQVKKGEITDFTLDKRFVTRNGSIFWAHLSASKIRFSQEQPEYLMLIIQDITRKKESERFMEYIAYHDQLTDCYNGRYYEEFIERQNNIEDFPISLIRINVNGLKLINETLNHRAGDTLLQTVARTIKKTCIESAMVARIGSNEFMVANRNQSERQLLNFVSILNHAFEDENVEGMKISVSLGYATWEDPDADFAEIYKLAESRMHSEEVVTKNSMYSKTIDIIINSLFEKNNREMLHSQRVSVICEKLARKMNFDQKNVEKIKIAGLMHDIGKIGISDEILNKNGRLNESERNQIEKHSDAGYRILSSATEFSEIAECVLTHHERWDGNGYPKGLSGTDIPIFSRIIAVADSFDAMTSKRAYREAMALDHVVDEMRINAGKQFDPTIVGLFLDNIEEFRDIV
jgi:PAS domain S-box-containing protein/diguanylate cyclase (GGDEF)-like protein/putative nucleotidyltransferase with HDIG domain